MRSNEQSDYLSSGSSYPQPLPNATASLVLGILSIVICGAGLVIGIIGLVLANKDLTLYNNHSKSYSLTSYNNTKTGRICSIIGIILSSLFILIYAGILIAAFSGKLSDI